MIKRFQKNIIKWQHWPPHQYILLCGRLLYTRGRRRGGFAGGASGWRPYTLRLRAFTIFSSRKRHVGFERERRGWRRRRGRRQRGRRRQLGRLCRQTARPALLHERAWRARLHERRSSPERGARFSYLFVISYYISLIVYICRILGISLANSHGNENGTEMAWMSYILYTMCWFYIDFRIKTYCYM